jgi:hypothetical protein
MFYIGYEDIDTARICGAWSPDGIYNWERFSSNPLVSPSEGAWDADACYKPTVVFDAANNRWLLWYNGRNNAPEYIGLVIHEGEELDAGDAGRGDAGTRGTQDAVAFKKAPQNFN